jgi:hypothetical protein
MVTINVLFPDGSIRGVPGQLREVIAEDNGRARLRFRQVPINCDPLWRYVERRGRWVAMLRSGPDVALFAPREAYWWQAIVQMHDEASPAPASAAA